MALAELEKEMLQSRPGHRTGQALLLGWEWGARGKGDRSPGLSAATPRALKTERPPVKTVTPSTQEQFGGVADVTRGK